MNKLTPEENKIFDERFTDLDHPKYRKDMITPNKVKQHLADRIKLAEQRGYIQGIKELKEDLKKRKVI